MEQLDLYGLLAEVEKSELEISRADYPDVMVITEDNPLRSEVHFWATDYTWHMAIHECEGLLAQRKQFREENPQSRYIKPVIYCDAWQSRGKNSQSWNIVELGHKLITTCPYCGVDLTNGKGTIILERRFDDRPYHCVYERPLPDNSVIELLAEAITEQLTPEEIQEVISGTAEIIVDNDPLCPICHESPRFLEREGTDGSICYKIACRCGILPPAKDYRTWESSLKSFDVFCTKERALEYWKKNRNEAVKEV